MLDLSIWQILMGIGAILAGYVITLFGSNRRGSTKSLPPYLQRSGDPEATGAPDSLESFIASETVKATVPLANQIIDLQDEITTIKIDFGKRQVRFEDEIAKLRTGLSHASEILAEKDNSIKQLQDANQLMIKAFDDMRSRLDKTDSELTRLREAYEGKVEALASTQREIGEIAAESQMKDVVIDALQKALNRPNEVHVYVHDKVSTPDDKPDPDDPPPGPDGPGGKDKDNVTPIVDAVSRQKVDAPEQKKKAS